MKKALLLLVVTLFLGISTYAQTTLLLASPQNGASYNYGDSVLIGWQFSGVSNVKVKYSTNAGSTYTDIGTFVANNKSPIPGYGICYWHVPNQSSTTCKIKIEDASNAFVTSVLTGYFTIKAPASVTITAPNGGESWTAGTNATISWNQSNVPAGYYSLYYSTDAGVSWLSVHPSYTTQYTSYTWPIHSSVNSKLCRIKIVSNSDTSVHDVSDANFTISKPVTSLTVTSPNGGESWASSSSQKITWSYSNLPSTTLKVDYSTNGGVSWTNVNYVAASNLSYDWTVPCGINSSQCKIRLSDYSDTTIKDVSNANFSITSSSSLTVTAPNGGETWGANTTQYITWTQSNLCSQYLSLYYSIDGGVFWNTITTVSASSGSYPWAIPSTLNSKTCRIKIADYSNANFYDISNANFTITAPVLSIAVTAPNGGEVWNAQTNHNITWTASNTTSNFVDLYYSIDGGKKYTFIASYYAVNGSYPWTTPNISSSTCKIKITNYLDTSKYDVSDANFTIQGPPITVTYPNGGESLCAGNSYNITWTATAQVSTVNILLSTNYGSTYTALASNIQASLGTYNYTIPANTIGQGFMIKVVDVANSLNFDASNSYYYVSAPITTSQPYASQSITAGTNTYIYWSVGACKSISLVDLSYSINNGSTWTSIATSVTATTSYYLWAVPNTPSTTCLVRVTDHNNQATYAQTSGVFTIVGSNPTITVSAPNGGENWNVGTYQYIQWSSSYVANVKLEYSTDGGSTYTTIISSVNASSSYYYWQVPNTPSTTCRVRVSDASNSSVNDISNANFTISKPSLTVTSPNGGETWASGTYKNITWTQTNLGSNNLYLYYSTNSGSTWTYITQTLASYLSYSWYVPTGIGSKTCKVKLIAATDTSVNDVSNANFEISAGAPSLTVNYPNGAENWNVGSSQYISWSSQNIANVKLEYSTNGGSTYTTIVTSTNASSSYYYWQVPNTPSTTCRVRVSDASNATVNDISNANFTISAPTPSITSFYYPNAGQQLTVGTNSYIYGVCANVANVKIELSTNGGTTWSTLTSSYATNGSYFYYTFIVPNTVSSNCKVRVSDASNASISLTSSVFSIINCSASLTISQPYTGQQYTGGSYTYIYWSANCISNVSIEYSANGGSTWSVVAASTSATTGYYYWAVPNAATTQAKIRIKDLTSGSTISSTSGTFTIGTPTITVSSPNGGENLTGGSTSTISWTRTNSNTAYVNLEYSTNNGATWSTIGYAYYTGNFGSYSWSVPNIASTQCLVRVSDYYNSSINDKSNNVFTIKLATPQVNVSTPNGGEKWAVGYSNYIYWSSVSVSNVKIEYTANNGVTWNVISQSYPASYGNYYWTVPNTPSTTCKVRVSDASNALVTDESNANFSIISPSLTVTSPNGAESWQGLTSHQITWSSSNIGGASYVNLEYSTNNGASWNYIVYGTYNYGYYSWSVPNTVSSTCLVRVTDYYNSSVTDVSNAVFSITAASTTLSIYAPNGGENFGVGSQQTISWYSQNISNVKLEYSTNGGSSYTTIISSTPNYGYYYWTIPNNASTQCRVRISDAANASTQSVSAANFSIISPSVKLTSPNGNEKWVGLTTQNISWTSSAISNYVTLQYSTNNVTWTNIGTAYSGGLSGSYAWKLPNISTTTARVRVLDYYNNSVSDKSDTTFSITYAPAALQLTSPNGFENYAVGSKYYIQWTSTSVSSVNLEYSTNNGSTWSSIANGVNAALGYYYWTVPNAASTTCLVRVSDANNASLSDISNNNFTIIAPYITVSYPNGSETFNVGNSYYIQWSSSGVATVTIEFSKDGGATYTTLATNVTNYGYYWFAPTLAQASAQCKVRVKDAASGSSIADASNANFTVLAPTPSIVVNSPYGGESWTVGSNYNITWSSVSVAAVKIQYSTNNGSSWSTITSSYPGVNSYYTWSVPNSVSATALIKISNAADSTLNDVSGVFNIVPVVPSLAIVYPNGGENLLVGAYTYIAWTKSNVTCVNLEISYNGGTSWTSLATNLTSNYYYWYVPNSPSTQCMVRVTDCYSSLSDLSNSTFTISTPIVNTNTITISTINKSTYCKGDSILVKFAATGVYNSGNYYSVQLSDASGLFSYPTFIGGKYSTSLTDSIWAVIPNSSANSTNYTVRIVANNLVATSSISSAFKVQGPTVDFAANPYQTIYLLPQEASIQFVPSTTGAVKSYAWSFGDGGTSSSKTPTHYYGSTIYHDVNLTVTDSNGCKSSAYKANYIRTEYYFNNTNIMPQSFTGTVTGVSFMSANIGCFTLSNGNCYITTDGGYTWVLSVTGLPLGTQLTGVSVINGYWVITGTNGTLCYSTNQGATWIPYYIGSTVNFNSVSIMSASRGYAVGTGGSIYIFNGTNWIQSVVSGISGVNFYGVASYGTNSAITVGTGGAVYYYNGTTWLAITSSLFSSSYTFTSVYTDVDATTLNTIAYVTSSNGSIYKMVYVNNAWTVTIVLSGTGTYFKSISGKGKIITAVGNNGVVYQSIDGGVTFIRFSIGVSNNINAVFYYNNRGYFAGDLGLGRAFGLAADTSTTTVADVTSFDKHASIYPNPTSTNVTIQVNGLENEAIEITLKDVTGRNAMIIVNEEISGTFKKQVDISSLAKGTYFVFINRSGNQLVRKLTIE